MTTSSAAVQPGGGAVRQQQVRLESSESLRQVCRFPQHLHHQPRLFEYRGAVGEGAVRTVQQQHPQRRAVELVVEALDQFPQPLLAQGLAKQMSNSGPLPRDLLRKPSLGIGEHNPVRGEARAAAQCIARVWPQAVEPGQFGDKQVVSGKWRG